MMKLLIEKNDNNNQPVFMKLEIVFFIFLFSSFLIFI